MFSRWRRKRESTPPAALTPDELLAQSVAGHFDGAVAEGATVWLGFGGARVECAVNGIEPAGGGFYGASLFFRIGGGLLGDRLAFASARGYDPDPQVALITGACEWASIFAPVLQAGLSGRATGDAMEERVTLDGREFRLIYAAMDRMMMDSDADETALAIDARRRFGDLALTVVRSGTLPTLASSGATLLGVFVLDDARQRTVEVKVNGVNWPQSDQAFQEVPGPRPGGAAMMRELAVLVPADLTPWPEPAHELSRAAVAETLTVLAGRASGPASTAGWRGWRAHRGTLAPALTPAQLADLEDRTGQLPTSYRAFLGEVAAAGAGPGFGLLPPQLDGAVIPLAHGGCGVTWVLRMDDTRFGEVWLTAAGSDGGYRGVAGDFGAWYRSWLEAAMRENGPWSHWDVSCCAPTSLMVNVLQGREDNDIVTGKVPAGAFKITFEDGPVDPCHGCVSLADQLGLPEDVFPPGELSTKH